MHIKNFNQGIDEGRIPDDALLQKQYLEFDKRTRSKIMSIDPLVLYEYHARKNIVYLPTYAAGFLSYQYPN